MEEWKEYKLGDILNFRRGHDLPKSEMKAGDIPVAGSNGIIGYHDTATPVSPCITIGRSGNVGTPYIYDKCWAHNTVLYVDDFKGNNPLYLFYLLKTLPLSSFGGGSAVPTLNRNHIHPLLVRHTSDLKLQERIATLLKSLDDKIDCNRRINDNLPYLIQLIVLIILLLLRRINDNLQHQAKALYKSWFVDYEPFKDGEFVESELGMIPKGWRLGTLGEILEIKYGKDHKKLSDGIIPVYGSGGLMRFAEKPLYEGESVLIPRKGTLNNVMYVNEAFWTVDTMFYTIPKMQNSILFAYILLSNKDLASMNSGSAVPSMTTEILNNIQIVMPVSDVLAEFNPLVSAYYAQIRHYDQETRRLAQLRDAILPRLMSGELKIDEVTV